MSVTKSHFYKNKYGLAEFAFDLHDTPLQYHHAGIMTWTNLILQHFLQIKIIWIRLFLAIAALDGGKHSLGKEIKINIFVYMRGKGCFKVEIKTKKMNNFDHACLTKNTQFSYQSCTEQSIILLSLYQLKVKTRGLSLHLSNNSHNM